MKDIFLAGWGGLASIAFSKGWAIPDDRNISSLTYTPIIKVTDARDGQRYKTVKIGSQVWMAENLNYDYNWNTAKSYCYDNDPSNCEKYGRLYTWRYAAIEACPDGWHLPSRAE